jgi:hypothetical protein
MFLCVLVLDLHPVTGETLMVPTCMGTSGGGKRLAKGGDRLGLYSSVLSHGGCGE